MAKIDEIKEQISLNKFIMGLISIIVFSVTGFVVSEYSNMQIGLLILAFLLLVVLIYVFILVFSKTIFKIKELKDL